jgi:hypothetical protein
MKYNNRRTQLALKRRTLKNKESGVSLVEILVYIALFSVIAVMTVSIIATTVNSSNRFTESSTTQTQVSQAASIIQRDIALSTAITRASPDRIDFTTHQGNSDFKVSLFEYIPGVTALSTLPTGVVEANLPNFPAIMSLRSEIGGSTAQTILVEGYEYPRVAYPNGLFTYYNSVNAAVNLTSTSAQNDLDRIARVEFHIAAKATGRASAIQIESSVTPAYNLPPNTIAGQLAIPECPANFSSIIRATEQTATLKWNAPAGATSYTLYTYDESGSEPTRSQIVPDPNITTYVIPSLTYGHTYRFTIQAAGSSGTTAECASDISTVVPEPIAFTNVNSLQRSLTLTKSDNTAESITRDAETNIPAKTASTTNVLQGNRYTVARALTNQLSWNETFGTTQFKVKIAGTSTVVGTIASGTLYFSENVSLGETNSYTVYAVNAGGESEASAAITLVSPPLASTFSASRPDTSTRVLTTDNAINVVSRAANTTGFKTQRTTANSPTTDCALTGALAANNFTGNTTTDPNVEWGSNTCYTFIPFNDAGNGAESAGLKVAQFPGKFSMKDISSTQYQYINSSAPLPSGTQCWVSDRGQTGEPCVSSIARSGTNKYGLGLFGSISNTVTKLTPIWQESKNAYGDYSVEKTRVATAGSVDQGSVTNTYVATYVTGPQSQVFENEMPGSTFNFKITASSAAGEKRTATAASKTSNPDIPKAVDNAFQNTSADPNYQRIYLGTDAGVFRGNATNIILTAESPTGKNIGTFPNGSGLQSITTPHYTFGTHSEYAYTTLNTSDGLVISATIGRLGSTTPGCGQPCTSSWQFSPEQYPNYYAGAHYRYNGGGEARSSANGGQGNTTYVPTPSTPTTVTEVSDGGQSTDCSTISETDVTFAVGCEYGSGIPPTPSGFVLSAQTTDLLTFKWDAVANATGYILSTTVNGVTATKAIAVTDTTTQIAAPAAGTSSSSTIKSTNKTTESPASSAIVATGTLATPTGLSATNTGGGNSTITWTAVTAAVKYNVMTTVNGQSSVTVVTTNSAATIMSVGENGTVKVQAVDSKGNISAYSGTVVVYGPPAAVAGLKYVSGTATTATVAWTAPTTAPINYLVTLTDVAAKTSTTVTVSGTATSVVLNAASTKEWTVTIQARNGASVGTTSSPITLAIR